MSDLLFQVGTVIIAAWTELPSEITLKTLVTGTARKLVSQFRLSYNMILNLLRYATIFNLMIITWGLHVQFICSGRMT